MIKFQYQALRKATSTALGARASKVDKIVVVESIPMFMVSTQALFITKSIGHLIKVGDLLVPSIRPANDGREIIVEGLV